MSPAWSLLVFVLAVCSGAGVSGRGIISDIADATEDTYLDAKCRLQNDTDACMQLFIRQNLTGLIIGGLVAVLLLIACCAWCCGCCRRNGGQVYHYQYPARSS